RPRRAPHRGSVRCRTPPQECPARRPGVSLDEASARISPLYRTILNETEAPLLTRADEDELEAFRAKRLVLEPGARGQSALRTVAPAARAAACRGRRRAASMLRKHRGADARASAARGGSGTPRFRRSGLSRWPGAVARLRTAELHDDVEVSVDARHARG